MRFARSLITLLLTISWCVVGVDSLPAQERDVSDSPASESTDTTSTESAGSTEPLQKVDDSDAAVDQTEQPSANDASSLTDTSRLVAFLDGFLSAQLVNEHVAGATLSVVVDDQIVVSRGYGFADVEQRIAVDPATTMFRIGSVSKLFTWTAVMQLVEQGKLDLDADVNTYLADSDIKVPDTFEQPITMKDLMCHTPGFEDHVIGLFGRNEQSLKPIGELMKEQMPRRVRPPGDLAAYSNHGTLLAAVIIEQVSGMSWEEFLQQQILSPLEMTNTMLAQPSASQLPETLSRGYHYNTAANEFEAEDFEYVPAAPAGCISTSADDMGHFMIAHLNEGQFKSNRILQRETTDLMHSRARWHDERLDAMCHGFWELHRNGVRILEHGGDTNLFHSLMTILPEQKVGLFVSYNTDNAGQLRNELRDAFLDRFFPVENSKPKPPEGFSARAERFAGSYKMLRYDHSTLAKLAMVVQVLPVAVRDDDRLSIGGKSYIEQEPLKFVEEHGSETVVFREDESGEITHLFINRAPAVALQKMEWFESPATHIGLLAVSMVVFISVIIGWPLVHVITKGELIAGERPSRMSRLASWFGWFAAIAFVAFTITLVVQAEEIVHGMPPVLESLLPWTPVFAVVAVLLVLMSGLSWVGRYWRLTGRVHYLLLAFAAVAAVWQLAFFNMLKLNS